MEGAPAPCAPAPTSIIEAFLTLSGIEFFEFLQSFVSIPAMDFLCFLLQTVNEVLLAVLVESKMERCFTEAGATAASGLEFACKHQKSNGGRTVEMGGG